MQAALAREARTLFPNIDPVEPAALDGPPEAAHWPLVVRSPLIRRPLGHREPDGPPAA
jgi:hypothetical protein